MAKIITKVVYSHDFHIGDRVQIDIEDHTVKGTLRMIEGLVTDKRGTAKAWIDMDGGAEGDYTYFMIETHNMHEIEYPEELVIEEQLLALNSYEFLDIEHIPKKKRKQ